MTNIRAASRVMSVGSYFALLSGIGTKAGECQLVSTVTNIDVGAVSKLVFAIERRNTLYPKILGHCSFTRTIGLTRMILRKVF